MAIVQGEAAINFRHAQQKNILRKPRISAHASQLSNIAFSCRGALPVALLPWRFRSTGQIAEREAFTITAWQPCRKDTLYRSMLG